MLSSQSDNELKNDQYVEILWNKVNAYFRGYLCAHENSKNFYTTKIPMLVVYIRTIVHV